MRDTFVLRFLLATFGGWVNREQAQASAFLVEENRVPRVRLYVARSRGVSGRRATD